MRLLKNQVEKIIFLKYFIFLRRLIYFQKNLNASIKQFLEEFYLKNNDTLKVMGKCDNAIVGSLSSEYLLAHIDNHPFEWSTIRDILSLQATKERHVHRRFLPQSNLRS